MVTTVNHKCPKCKVDIYDQITSNDYVPSYCDNCMKEYPPRELVVEDIKEIVHISKNVRATLKRCKECGISFTATQPCIYCELRKEDKKKYKQFMDFMKK